MTHVSIIMPAYNAEKWIARAIQSVQAQTHKDWELCIVDDASTDNTLQVVENFMCEDNRIRLERNETNHGCGLARRRAIAMAKGEYIGFLDSDDMFAPNFIETMLSAMYRNHADIAVCGTKEYDDGKYIGSYLCDEEYCASKKDIYYQYINGTWIMQYNGNKLYRKEVIDKHEYCDFRFCEDSYTTPKWLWEAENVVVIPDRLYSYYKHAGSNSADLNSPLVKSYDTVRCVWSNFCFAKEQGFHDLLPRFSMFAYEHLIRCINGFDVESEEYKFVDSTRDEFLKYNNVLNRLQNGSRTGN